MDEFQPTPLSEKHCKDLLSEIAKMLCVKEEMISNRLLSEEDKQDLLDGNIPIESLITHVKVWIANGMPDYAHGNTYPAK
jgi:hypothetical protein